jgi:hypothetical protein
MIMKTMLNLKSTLALFSLLLVVSCNYKKVERNPHESDTAPGTPGSLKPTSLEALKAEERSLLEQTDLNAIHTQMTSIKTESDALLVLEKLESSLINSKVWRNPNLKNHEKVVQALSYYNFSLVQLNKLAPQSAQTDKHLDRFQSLAMESCDADLAGCQNISWLKQDARSRDVIEILATRLDAKLETVCKDKIICGPFVKQYFDLLAVGISLGNATKSIELESLYLRRASLYSTYIGGDDLNAKNYQLRHGRIFEMILDRHPLSGDDKKLSELVQQFKPWSYSRLEQNVFPFGTEKIFSFAARHLMYTADKKTLSKEFKDSLVAIKAKNDKSEVSFLNRFKELQSSSDSASIFKNLNLNLSAVESDSFYNEYFYIIDRLYRDHLSMEDVSQIWEASNKDAEILTKTIDLYLKVELVYMLVDTNRYFAKTIKDPRLTSNRLFIKTIEESQPLTSRWQKMFSRMDRLRIFCSLQMRTDMVVENQLKLQTAIQQINSLPRNTNFLSVYPNMLMLGYFMIDADAAFEYTTFWGAKLRIDPTTIVDYMLSGGFDQPWYFFSGDSAKVNKTGIIYSLYYALNLGSFETFSTIKDERGSPRLDRISFFKKALKKTMADVLSTIEDTTRNSENNRVGASGIAALNDVCKYEKEGVKDYSVSVSYEDFSKYVLFGARSSGLIQTALSFYGQLDKYHYAESKSKISEGNRPARVTIQDRLTQLKAMMIPLRDSIKKIPGKSSAEIEKLLVELEKEFTGIEQTLRALLIEGTTAHREISACLDRMVEMERERQGKVFLAEMKHLEGVYNAMKAIHEAPEAQKAELAQSLATELKLGKTEVIVGKKYKSNKLDILTRFGRFANAYQPKVDLTEPDSYSSEKMMKTEREVNFIDSKTGLPVSKENFIASGMSMHNRTNASTVSWLGNVTADTFNTKLAALISLYRLKYDLSDHKGLEATISAKDLIDVSVAKAKFLKIRPEEKVWMRMMGQFELIPVTDMHDFLFDKTLETTKGILDDTFHQATKIDSDLDEVLRFKTDFDSKGSLIFPLPAQGVEDEIFKQYAQIVSRSEAVVFDFIKAIKAYETKITADDLKMTYRLSQTGEDVYSPTQIVGGTSILIDRRDINDIQKKIEDFHFRLTQGKFRTAKPAGSEQ